MNNVMKKQIKVILSGLIVLILSTNFANAQDDSKLKLSGELLTDQRFLLNEPNEWAWNENRLTFELNKKITDNSKFYSEVWLRNFGLPQYSNSADLYNKGIIDPYNLELKEAYVELYGFLFKNLDIKIGRQRIAWGTADKLNPTDNLNPYDLEDILDFGRHRGSDAISLDYYLNSNFSMHSVYVPFYKPANLPVGIFSDILSETPVLPTGLTLMGMSDTLLIPEYNLAKSSTAGLKFKGLAAGFDFSLSYVWGRDGLPIPTYNTFIPVDMTGGIEIKSQLSFARTHIFGIDLAGSLGGVGIWAEAAGFLPDTKVIMTNDLTALYPMSPVPVTQDSVLLKTELYTKFVIGADYHFANGSYLNFQYMHGFIHERGNENLNDYFFLNYDIKFFESKLKIRPIGGGFIISDWDDIKNNYSLIYIPEISYMATDNTEISVSTAVFDGKGTNMFANLSDYNMFMFKVKYSF